jgi:hypothetical protein
LKRSDILRKTTILIVFILNLLLLVGCNNNYSTLNEAIKHAIPYEVKEVIHIENLNNGSLIVFVIRPENKGFDALGTVYFKGNNQMGWEMDESSLYWKHTDNKDMTVHYQNIVTQDNDSTVSVTYGKINNLDINRIDVADKETQKFKEIPIIERKMGRYYFSLGYHLVVRGIAENNKIISQQGNF